MEISFTRVALLAAALFFVGCDQKPQPVPSFSQPLATRQNPRY